MTREEALEFIAQSIKSDVDMAMVADAIKALEQEPFKPMVEIDLYSVIKQKYIEREVLDKIRAEIRKKMKFNSFNEGYVLYDDITEVLDKYKAEIEPQESENKE